MTSSMIHSITTPHEFDSRVALENYLERNYLQLAASHEVPEELLLKLSTPDWSKDRPQGSLLLLMSSTKPQGVLSKFIANMCYPFCFIREGVMPKDTIVWVYSPDNMAS